MSDSVLAFLSFGALTFLVVAWPRMTSKARVIRRIYRHVDEPLGARRFENDRRAANRRGLSFFSPKLATLIYPPTQFTGATVLPGARRMRRYIRVEYAHPGPRWPRPWRVWHIAALELRWTSEANALGEGFGTLLTRKVAQALVLRGSSELEQHPAFERGYFRLERAKAVKPAPVNVPFGEATDE